MDKDPFSNVDYTLFRRRRESQSVEAMLDLREQPRDSETRAEIIDEYARLFNVVDNGGSYMDADRSSTPSLNRPHVLRLIKDK